MDETGINKLNVLYVGNDQITIDLFVNSGLFELTVKGNGLAAIYWLTDNSFRLFDLDKDTRFENVYEEKKKIDAILCEYLLPGINGLTFFYKLKLNKFYQKTPFIILSLFRDYSLKQEALVMGIDDFYHKSIKPDIIFSRIQSLFKNQELIYHYSD